jgi:hypothetical protein
MDVNLEDFIGKWQFAALKKLTKESDEKSHFIDKLDEISHIIATMPTVEDDCDKVCYLHYIIGGNSDCYILQKDCVLGEAQLQAFGYTCLNGDFEMAEMGYVSIKELLENEAQLDLYFSPTPLKTIQKELAW